MINTNSIQKSNLIVKIRENLYQLPQGQLVGFGPLESENGTSTCWTCFEPECEHVEAIYQTWLDGMSVEAKAMPFNAIPETWYTVNNGIDNFSVDRKTGKVSYEDA
jgi:hypothetical protein